MTTDTLTRPDIDLEELFEQEHSCGACDSKATWRLIKRCHPHPLDFVCDVHYAQDIANWLHLWRSEETTAWLCAVCNRVVCVGHPHRLYERI